MHHTALAVAILVALPPITAGDELEPALEPIVRMETVAVVSIRIDEVDPGQWFDFVLTPIRAALATRVDQSEIDALTAEHAESRARIEALHTELVRCGATRAALAVGFDGESHALIGITGPRFDGASARDVVQEHGLSPSRVHEGVLLIGERDDVDRSLAGEPTPRPDLAEALAAAHGPITVAVALPEPLRRALAEMIPVLPPAFGGAEPRPFLEHARWLALSTRTAGAGAIDVVVDCSGPDGARSALDVVRTTLEHTLVSVPAAPAMLTPTIVESRLEVTIDAERAAIVARALVPTLMAARANARRVQAMTEVRTLVTGIHLYASEHDNAWPPSLQALADNGYVDLDAVRARDDATVYIRPSGDVARRFDPQRMLVYRASAGADDEPVIAGFADGHVELVTADRFRTLLREARASAADGS